MGGCKSPGVGGDKSNWASSNECTALPSMTVGPFGAHLPQHWLSYGPEEEATFLLLWPLAIRVDNMHLCAGWTPVPDFGSQPSRCDLEARVPGSSLTSSDDFTNRNSLCGTCPSVTYLQRFLFAELSIYSCLASDLFYGLGFYRLYLTYSQTKY